MATTHVNHPRGGFLSESRAPRPTPAPRGRPTGTPKVPTGPRPAKGQARVRATRRAA